MKRVEFFKYILIACVGGVLDLGLFYILYTFTDIHVQLVNLISTFVGVTTNFLINYYFNFKASSKFFKRYISFLSAGIIGFVIVSLLVFLSHQTLGWNAILVKIFATMFATLVQYVINRYISFRRYRAI